MTNGDQLRCLVDQWLTLTNGEVPTSPGCGGCLAEDTDFCWDFFGAHAVFFCPGVIALISIAACAFAFVPWTALMSFSLENVGNAIVMTGQYIEKGWKMMEQLGPALSA